jgi:hypothetical protein
MTKHQEILPPTKRRAAEGEVVDEAGTPGRWRHRINVLERDVSRLQDEVREIHRKLNELKRK